MDGWKKLDMKEIFLKPDGNHRFEYICLQLSQLSVTHLLRFFNMLLQIPEGSCVSTMAEIAPEFLHEKFIIFLARKLVSYSFRTYYISIERFELHVNFFYYLVHPIEFIESFMYGAVGHEQIGHFGLGGFSCSNCGLFLSSLTEKDVIHYCNCNPFYCKKRNSFCSSVCHSDFLLNYGKGMDKRLLLGHIH